MYSDFITQSCSELKSIESTESIKFVEDNF